jgi:hypothetical protein
MYLPPHTERGERRDERDEQKRGEGRRYGTPLSPRPQQLPLELRTRHHTCESREEGGMNGRRESGWSLCLVDLIQA